MAVGLDTAEFNPNFHTDLDLLDITVRDLRQQFDAVFEFGDPDSVGSLIGKLRRGNANDGIGHEFAGIRQDNFFEFAVTAFRADQTVREDNFAALGALAGFKAVTVFAISPYS